MQINKMFFKPAPVILAALLFGCTQQSWYDGVRQGAENECRMQQQSAMESCLERLHKSAYEDYERARQEAKQ